PVDDSDRPAAPAPLDGREEPAGTRPRMACGAGEPLRHRPWLSAGGALGYGWEARFRLPGRPRAAHGDPAAGARHRGATARGTAAAGSCTAGILARAGGVACAVDGARVGVPVWRARGGRNVSHAPAS